MKKVLLVNLLVCLFFTAANAQRDNMRGPAQEKIEAFKIAFFTEQLQLTPDESKVFWPLYNEFENKREDLREKYDLKGDKLELLSDQEVKTHIMNQIKMEEDLTALRRDYVLKFMDVLPVRKVAMLQKIDTQFKKKLLEEIQKRRTQRQGGVGPRRN